MIAKSFITRIQQRNDLMRFHVPARHLIQCHDAAACVPDDLLVSPALVAIASASSISA